MAPVGRKGGGQDWSTFLKNHAEGAWACDFVQSYDIFFRQVFAFFAVQLSSRRGVYMSATRNPTQAWAAQQLRNAMMDGEAPQILIRDRHDKFGAAFDNVVEGAGGRVIKTAIRMPKMNAVAERSSEASGARCSTTCLSSMQTTATDSVASTRPTLTIAGPIKASVSDPGQQQRCPRHDEAFTIRAVLGGLHADYRRAA